MDTYIIKVCDTEFVGTSNALGVIVEPKTEERKVFNSFQEIPRLLDDFTKMKLKRNAVNLSRQPTGEIG